MCGQRLGARTRTQEVQRRFPAGVPMLDPIADLRIEDEAFKKLLEVRPRAVALAGYMRPPPPPGSRPRGA